MRGFIFTLILAPTLLVGDINPPRTSTVTVTVHVEFVDPPVSSEMTPEEIDTTSKGMCSVNPDEPTEIICQ